ncbi:unnamed protein product [Spodoptera exigua]|nr:unnamed protein product [Spodoptera exigua]
MPQNKLSIEEKRLRKKLAERRRMAKIKNDPDLYAQWLVKSRESYQRKKARGTVLPMSVLTPSQQKIRRKKSRQSSRRYYLKKKMDKLSATDELPINEEPIYKSENRDPLSNVPQSAPTLNTYKVTTKHRKILQTVTQDVENEFNIINRVKDHSQTSFCLPQTSKEYDNVANFDTPASPTIVHQPSKGCDVTIQLPFTKEVNVDNTIKRNNSSCPSIPEHKDEVQQLISKQDQQVVLKNRPKLNEVKVKRSDNKVKEPDQIKKETETVFVKIEDSINFNVPLESENNESVNEIEQLDDGVVSEHGEPVNDLTVKAETLTENDKTNEVDDDKKVKREKKSPIVRRVAFRAHLKDPIDHHRRGPKGLMFSRVCEVSAMRHRDLGPEREKEQGVSVELDSNWNCSGAVVIFRRSQAYFGNRFAGRHSYAPVTPLVPQVSMGGANHLPSGDLSAGLPPIS